METFKPNRVLKRLLTAVTGAILVCACACLFHPQPKASAAPAYPAESGYRYFSAPQRLLMNSGSLYVLDEYFGALEFDSDLNLAASYTAPGCYTGLAVSGGTLLVISDNTLTLAPGDTRALTAPPAASTGTLLDLAPVPGSPAQLYALKSSGEILKLTLTSDAATVTLTLEPFTLTVPGATLLRASTDSLAVTVRNGGSYSLKLYNHSGSPLAGGLSSLSRVNDFQLNAGADTAYIATVSGLEKYDLGTGALLFRYALNLGGTVSTGILQSAAALALNGDTLYVADKLTLTVQAFSAADLSFTGNIFASGGTDPDRLWSPQSAYSWNGSLYIADTGNARIIAQTPDGDRFYRGGSGYVPVRPTSVTVDSLGEVYFADNGTEIVRLDKSLYFKEKYTLNGGDCRITAIAVSPAGTLYAADSKNGKIWSKPSSGTEFTEYADVPSVVSLAASYLKDTLYALSAGGNVTAITDGAADTGASLGNIPDAAALTEDGNGDLFFLITGGGIGKIEKRTPSGGALTDAEETPLTLPDGIANPGAVSLCADPVTGDLYAADPVMHAVWTVTGAGAAVPDCPNNDGAYRSGDALTDIKIVVLNSAKPLFSSLHGEAADLILPKGTNLVLLNKDLTCSDYLSFVYWPERDMSGYVLKSAFGEPLVTAPPAFTDGIIYLDSAEVCKYPSQNGPKVLGEDGKALKLKKSDKVTLTSMPAYSDGTHASWYCIDLGEGKFGFLTVLSVSRENHRPAEGTLVTNAVIKSGETPVFICSDSTGKYLPMDGVPVLKDGDRVRVENTFDPNTKYTLIRYQESSELEIWGYVETKYIKYDTPSNFQYIMLAVLIGVIALAAVGIVFWKRRSAGKLRSV